MTKRIGIQAAPGTEVPGLDQTAYHVWFSPRRRKHALAGDIYPAVIRLIERIAGEKGIAILERAGSLDHIHLLVQTPAGMTLARAMQFIKGASSRYVFLEFRELKMDLGHDHFWQRGYGYRPVHPSFISRVAAYIRRHEPQAQHEGPASLERRSLRPSPGPAPVPGNTRSLALTRAPRSSVSAGAQNEPRTLRPGSGQASVRGTEPE